MSEPEEPPALIHKVVVSELGHSGSTLEYFDDDLDDHTYVAAASHTLVTMAANTDEPQKEFIKSVIEDYQDRRNEIINEEL